MSNISTCGSPLPFNVKPCDRPWNEKFIHCSLKMPECQNCTKLNQNMRGGTEKRGVRESKSSFSSFFFFNQMRMVISQAHEKCSGKSFGLHNEQKKKENQDGRSFRNQEENFEFLFRGELFEKRTKKNSKNPIWICSKRRKKNENRNGKYLQYKRGKVFSSQKAQKKERRRERERELEAQKKFQKSKNESTHHQVHLSLLVETEVYSANAWMPD